MKPCCESQQVRNLQQNLPETIDPLRISISSCWFAAWAAPDIITVICTSVASSTKYASPFRRFESHCSSGSNPTECLLQCCCACVCWLESRSIASVVPPEMIHAQAAVNDRPAVARKPGVLCSRHSLSHYGGRWEQLSKSYSLMDMSDRKDSIPPLSEVFTFFTLTTVKSSHAWRNI